MAADATGPAPGRQPAQRAPTASAADAAGARFDPVSARALTCPASLRPWCAGPASPSGEPLRARRGRVPQGGPPMRPGNPEALSQPYDPGRIEPPRYPFWEQQGVFRPDPASDREPFVVTMPPPNVT